MVLYRVDGPGSPLRWDAAKKAARIWIDQLPIDRSECAILAFNAGTYKHPELVHTFSIDQQDLKDSLNFVAPAGGTDYNGAFLGKAGNPGAFDIARLAKY